MILEKIKKLYKIQIIHGYIPNEYADINLTFEKNGKRYLREEFRRMLKVVLVGGAFEIIHPGHCLFLNEAKKLGNFLVVIIARNKTVEKRKGICIVDENVRKQVVECLKPVDIAILGDENDFLKPVKRVMPDIIALGYDQDLDLNLKREISKMGIEIVKINKKLNNYSTKNIVKKILENFKSF